MGKKKGEFEKQELKRSFDKEKVGKEKNVCIKNEEIETWRRQDKV